LVTRRRGIQTYETYKQPLIEKRKTSNKSKAKLEQLQSDPQGKREAPAGLIKSKKQSEVKRKRLSQTLVWSFVPSVVPRTRFPNGGRAWQIHIPNSNLPLARYGCET
jgi:hypothetical protein